MVTAFVMFIVEPGRVTAIAERLLEVPGIAEVHSVAGPYDLVAIARVKKHEELADLVADHVAHIEGIERTETLIAFRAYSKRDLGLMWDVGASD
ncbi:MAG: Lrp/AsnC ligand binding domain-containing protein [Candidatus Eremiobacteraeota bacterium]|nr:Lrp/AsnC ligand binding domain-containing protein [Candidatus Eremiobacteraeota bacterium]